MTKQALPVRAGVFIHNWWDDAVAFIAPLLVVILGTLISDGIVKTALFGNGVLRGSAFWLLVLVLVFQAAVFFWVTIPKRKTLHDIEVERDELLEVNSTLISNPQMIAEGYLVSFAQARLRFGCLDEDCERITLYVLRKDEACFVQAGRFSSNQQYRGGGRGEYPIDQGCLGRAWRNGTAAIGDLPDPESDFDAYLDEQEKLGIDRFMFRKKRMYPVFYFGYRVMDPACGCGVGVVVVESTRAGRFEIDDLERAFDSEAKRFLPVLVQGLRLVLPDASDAKSKGL